MYYERCKYCRCTDDEKCERCQQEYEEENSKSNRNGLIALGLIIILVLCLGIVIGAILNR